MMTSRHLLPISAALLLCFQGIAEASTLATEPSAKSSPAQPRSAPVFSLGTISIAPPQQSPGSAAGSPPKSPGTRKNRSAHRSRRLVDPVPLRIYARA